jgi:tetratricopeptide (TPR) repeat protein
VLRPVLRSYPPNISSDEQRREVERRWHEAEDALKRFDEAHPNQSPVEYRMGELYRFGNNLDIKGAADECVEHLQRAVALQPDFAEAYLELGMFYTDSGPRWASLGETNLKKAIELSRPTPVPRAWRALSLAYYYQTKFTQAVSAADRYLLLVPDDEEVRQIKTLAADALLAAPRRYRLVPREPAHVSHSAKSRPVKRLSSRRSPAKRALSSSRAARRERGAGFAG